jgi:predicted dehydrogenase
VFRVGGPGGIAFEQLPIESAEPLKLQFDAFLDSVETRQAPKLDGSRARHTLEIALAVLAKIEEHASVVAQTLASGWKP